MSSEVAEASSSRPCVTDFDCSHREQCLDSRAAPGQYTCHCFRFIFSDRTMPDCIELNAKTAAASLLHWVLIVGTLGALYHHVIAFFDHMTNPPLRKSWTCCGGDQLRADSSPIAFVFFCGWMLPSQHETVLSRFVCLRTLFLLSSWIYLSSGVVFLMSAEVMMWGRVNTKWFEDAPDSPFVISLSLHLLFADYWMFVFACVWIRVAARLHDRSKPARGLWLVALSLDGTGLGLLLSFLFAIPLGALVFYCIVEDLGWIGSAVATLVLVIASACFFLGSWLLADARTGEGLLCFSWCWRAPRVSVHPALGGGSSTTDGNKPPPPEPTLPSGGQAGLEQSEGGGVSEGEQPSTRSSSRRTREDEDLITSVSGMTLLSTAGQGDYHPRRADADVEKGEKGEKRKQQQQQSMRKAEAVPVTVPPPTGAGGRHDDGLRQKMRVVQRDARTLSFRVASLLMTATMFLNMRLVIPYLKWNYFLHVVNDCIGYSLVVVANLNCLYYLSPLPRRTIQSWILSDSVFFSWLGSMLAPMNPYGAGEDDE